jgi:hypothetical protein
MAGFDIPFKQLSPASGVIRTPVVRSAHSDLRRRSSTAVAIGVAGYMKKQRHSFSVKHDSRASLPDSNFLDGKGSMAVEYTIKAK